MAPLNLSTYLTLSTYLAIAYMLEPQHRYHKPWGQLPSPPKSMPTYEFNVGPATVRGGWGILCRLVPYFYDSISLYASPLLQDQFSSEHTIAAGNFGPYHCLWRGDAPSKRIDITPTLGRC
jgi:hypothetical protein